MRNLLLALSLLVGFSACKNDDDDDNVTVTPAADPNADWAMSVITASTRTIVVDDLPAPDTNASVTNYPQVLMTRPSTARFEAPAGFVVNLFEERIPDARNICVAPNGDVFVAQSNMNRISVLRDTDGDGDADTVTTWAEGGIISRPYGMAFYNGKFYVANTGAVVRYDYTPGQTTASAAPTTLATYAGGGQHPARSLVLDTVNGKMYIGIGSTMNVGIEDNPQYASVQQFNLDGSGQTTYAAGIRNPQGLAMNYTGGTPRLWALVNERDGIGDELVPDYLTAIPAAGAFYGWPFVYLRPDKKDPRITATDPRIPSTRTPEVLIEAHSAALGLLFYTGTQFPQEYRGDAFLACRGSWNRAKGSGYKILRVRMTPAGAVVGGYEDFVRGWNTTEGQTGVPRVFGRPMNLAIAKDGSLLIADDAGAAVWRLRYKG